MAVLQTPWYGRAMEALKLNGKGLRIQEAYAWSIFDCHY